MNVTFQKDEFIEKLAPAMGSVSNKNTISSIEGVLIEADKNTGYIKLSAYDMKKGVVGFLKAERILEGGSYIINAQRLMQILRLLPDDIINLTVDEKYNTVISSGKSNFSLFALRGSDFPKLPELKGENGFIADSFVIKKMIGKVIHSVAEQDTRPMLCGAFFKIKKNKLEIISCDSYTLSKCEIKSDISDVKNSNDMDFSFIVPGHALNELVKILSDKGGSIRVMLTRKHAIFNFEDLTFFTRLIDEEYIDYTRIIPKSNDIFVTVDRQRFLAGLERANLIAEEKSSRSYVKLIIDGDTLALASKSANGEVYDEMSCAHEGAPIKIAFNCRYLINSVRAADSDVIDLTFKSPTQSVTVAPHDKKDDEDFFYMIQPVRMNE
ncbi:MAG: DNA polymerase III subunit beta [Clostridia bacterium]|nr:DNA polymerase III subunit beta [Clostridia bacterium]